MMKGEKINMFVWVLFVLTLFVINYLTFGYLNLSFEKAYAPTIPTQAEPFYGNITA